MSKIKEIVKSIRTNCRSWYLQKGIQTLKNEKPTIIGQNCYAAIFLHDYKLAFSSPTVNLYFSVPDYIKFCKDIEGYIKLPLEKVETKDDYPVGRLGDIIIHFVHYHSFEEAKNKWLERSKRIDLNNLYFVMSDKDGCTYQDLIEFDKLPCKNKVVFTHKPYPEIKSAYYVKGYENDRCVGEIYLFKKMSWKRIWDDCNFDFVSFIKGA